MAIVLFYITIKFDEFLLSYSSFFRRFALIKNDIKLSFYLRDDKCETTICDEIFAHGNSINEQR